MTRPTQNPKDVLDAAAFWYARMCSDVKTSADADAFDAWLAMSPDHGDAYAELCALSGRFDSIADHADISLLRAETQRLEESQRAPFHRRMGVAWSSAALAVAASVALLFISLNAAETHDWTTARGEKKEIALSDGSHIVLGSDSRLQSRFQLWRRAVKLDRGQAFFTVAHNANRPFVVTADNRSVTALGTAFDVRAYPGETTVTLLKGSVAIGREGEVREAILKPNQQFSVVSGVPSIRDVNASAETAWRTGVLEFSNASLDDALTEFNRNAPHAIILLDSRLSHLRVSGVVHTKNPWAFAQSLVPAYPISATLQRSGDVTLDYKAD